MPEEHFCKEHGVPFIKTSWGWAHQVKDKDGNQVMTSKNKPKWCREEIKQEATTAPIKAEISTIEIRLRIAEIVASLAPIDIETLLDYANAINRWVNGQLQEKKQKPVEDLFPPETRRNARDTGIIVYEHLRKKVPHDRWTDREITLWLDSKFQVGTDGLYETLGKLTKEQADILGEEIKKRCEKY